MIERITTVMGPNAIRCRAKCNRAYFGLWLLGVFNWWRQHREDLSPDAVLAVFSNIIPRDRYLYQTSEVK